MILSFKKSEQLLITDDCEIQDVEGVKRIAPPLTAQTNDSTGLLLIASDSL